MKRAEWITSALTIMAAAWMAGCAKTPKASKNMTAMPEAGVSLTSLGVGDALEVANFQKGTAFYAVNPRPALPAVAGEELWVIYRPEREMEAEPDSEFPGTGSLMAKIEEEQAPLPLRHTDVKASVAGYIASVDVTQRFENPYQEKIEAIYVFPLPENGAVNEFVMTVGERRIRGIVRERTEAERIYNDAKRQGYTASLLTQERPNIFTQAVANIEPGKQIDISIRYYNTLSYADGWYEFVFPMVVGPRFNPPGSWNGVGAVPASGLARSGQSTDVHYLRPGARSGHDISLRVEVNAGVAIEEFECSTHPVRLEEETPWRKGGASAGALERLVLELEPRDAIPNKDFVMRYRVAGKSLKPALLTHEDHRGGFFTLMLYPPASLEALDRAPLELVFVLDCSGSMKGAPLRQAKAAIRWALRNMDERDTFQLINFSVDARQFGQEPVAATEENIRRALRYLDSLESEGGTMMIEGIKAALDFPHRSDRLRFVCFLTDGFIGNESDILGAIQEKLGASRIFSFGVGSAPNRFLMDGMARAGRGAVAYLGLKDDGAKVMRNFFDRISHPALTDVKIDWHGFKVSDVYPKRLPDVFKGRPLVITGRFERDSRRDGKIELSGRAGGSKVRIPLALRDTRFGESAPALPSIWARMKIAELTEQSFLESSAWAARQIRQTALDFQLLSPYTAFLALDASRQTAGESGVTVPVAVPVPEGVRYETTVAE